MLNLKFVAGGVETKHTVRKQEVNELKSTPQCRGGIVIKCKLMSRIHGQTLSQALERIK